MNKEKLIFLDTETTGAGPDDRLCQVAYRFRGEEFESLFKPPIPIGVEAMSISHITNRMVEGKENFIGSRMHGDLRNLFSEKNIMVAHNAGFDADMLKKEGLEIPEIIDTLKVVHHLDEDAEIPRYNMQYLRYYFDLEVDDATAHNALGDVRVLEKLFDHLCKKFEDRGRSEDDILREMIEVSSRPILVKKFNFGKYNEMKVAEVLKTDRGYLEWLLNEKIKTKNNGGENDENWIYTLEYHLK
ncbi:MAG: exonuclease domain-containing protein [Candidatus Moranbacteria bacterium]|jgi:DNA polymerase III epsilon subunit-like protein|nr:exonuclease domain-containing protein [Candidatus Moranbacteria bacterium]MDD5652311.1 exonuclease domain-containing protein [Candidatus Moranbacteria bacterium]MDX9856059.1 exonuclease domain-containing protein [Candidatus Moranbacteria bacterium]